MCLGGLKIPHDRESVGHSDADVLLHAITDALLGAAALGDIGEMFPDTDPANRGRDSSEMLRAARDAVASAGWEITNLGPLKRQIGGRVAGILGIDPSQVGIQAKTGEGLGAIGSQEAIAAVCVALLQSQEGSRQGTQDATPGSWSVPTATD